MNPKHLLPLLLLALTACQPPQTVENTNLCNYLPPHSEKTRLDDEDAHRFDVAADRISAATAHGNDSKRKHCGQTWRSVASAAVSLEDKNATVSFDPAKTNPAALVEAVEDGGFEASL